jgi:hypothetical protein
MTDYMRKGSVTAKEGNIWLSEWSKALDVGTVCLFGGEPLMNKDISSWIKLTRKYFPHSNIKIISNGFYLEHKNILADLFEAGNTTYQISLHWREGDKFNNIKKNLIGQINQYPNWKVVKSNRKEVILAAINKTVTVQLAVFGEFVQPYKGHGTSMQPWNSDNIEASYSNCGSPLNPILYKNKIYKCGPIANLRDTLELFNLQDDPAWQKYLTYSGYTTLDVDELIADYSKPNNICSMCASNTEANIDHYSPTSVMEKKEIKWQH